MLHPARHILWLPALTAAFAAPAWAQPSAPPTLDQLLASLADPALNSRSATVDRIIELTRDADAARHIAAILSDPATDPDLRARLFAGIARAWDPPGRLYPPALTAAQSGDSAAMNAVAAYRTPTAAKALIDLLLPDRPAAARQAAADALVRMTGRDDLGQDPAAWSAWFETHGRLRPTEWQEALLQGVWRRSLRLASDQSSLIAQLVDAQRKLYFSLPSPPAQDRPRLIAQLLTGDRSALRDLAFELVSREVSAGTPVDGQVSAAALQLLDSPLAPVRARAAGLLLQLAPSDIGPRIAAALARETDPAAAAQLLLGVARWTDPAARPATLRWLATDGPTRAAAVDAVLSLLNGGLLNDRDDRALALHAVRAISDAQMPPAGCRILAQLGDADDERRLIALLASPSAAVRAAAAGSVADRPDAWGAILDAARNDPGLFEYAVQATVSRHADAEGFLALLQAQAPNEESRLDGLLRAGAALSVTELLAVGSKGDVPPQLREAILARLLEHGPTAVANDPREVAAGLLVLAKTRLTLGRPDLAVAAMDALPPDAPSLDRAEVFRTRAIALIWTNHLDAAAALDAPADTWLDALELAAAERHAGAIAARIASLFGQGLTPEQSARLARLQRSEPPHAEQPIDDPSKPG